MIDLWLVRHGETDWNRELRFQGQLDVPLNALGLQQAQRLSKYLAKRAPQPLLVSDLLRTRQTAQPLSERWQIQAELMALWAAAGFDDTLLRWKMKLEVANGHEKEIQPRVQA